jgi:hypothetical protein
VHEEHARHYQDEGSEWSGQYRFADMNNLHTRTIGGANLVITSVVIMHCKFLELSGYVVCGAEIQVSVGISIA